MQGVADLAVAATETHLPGARKGALTAPVAISSPHAAVFSPVVGGQPKFPTPDAPIIFPRQRRAHGRANLTDGREDRRRTYAPIPLAKRSCNVSEVLQQRPHTRGLWALGIVAGGVVAASLLGRPELPSGEGGPKAGDNLALRRRAESCLREPVANLPSLPRGEIHPDAVSPFPAQADAAVAVRAERPDVLPPTLAKSFPAERLPASARWGVSMGIGMPGSGIVDGAPRIHRIVNGDSLPALAKRYLGSEDRAAEILEANRDVLSSPDALPLGIELKIPPRGAPKPRAAAAPTPAGLVPIRPRGPQPRKAPS